MTIAPLMIEGPDLLIVLAIAILLFGGSRLAGVGKSAGRAIREFKEETSELGHSDAATVAPAARPATTTVPQPAPAPAPAPAPQTPGAPSRPAASQAPAQVVDAELVPRA